MPSGSTGRTTKGGNLLDLASSHFLLTKNDRERNLVGLGSFEFCDKNVSIENHPLDLAVNTYVLATLACFCAAFQY